MAKFKILSIDGGGLRALVPILMLKQLEEKTGKPVHEMFDLMAGTSVGGMIVSALSVKGEEGSPRFTLDEVEEMFINRAREIVPEGKKLGQFWGQFQSLFTPEFGARGLERLLKDIFNSKKLADCTRPLWVPSFDIQSSEPVFFTSREAELYYVKNSRLFDVCRATFAHPTYFPAHTFRYNKHEVTCVDGGTFMNNPTLGAVVEILKPENQEYYGTENISLNDISVLSLGTGHYNETISWQQGQQWGKLKWVRPISNIAMLGNDQATDFEMQQLLPRENYFRANIDITEKEQAEMDVGATKMHEYLKEEVDEQFITNVTLQKSFDQFIARAELNQVRSKPQQNIINQSENLSN